MFRMRSRVISLACLSKTAQASSEVRRWRCSPCDGQHPTHWQRPSSCVRPSATCPFGSALLTARCFASTRSSSGRRQKRKRRNGQVDASVHKAVRRVTQTSSLIGRPRSLSPFQVIRDTVKAACNGSDHVVRDAEGQCYVYRAPVQTAPEVRTARQQDGEDGEACERVRQWLHPEVLQRRLRAVLVQHLLLSPSPHTSQTLIEHMLRVGLDTTTVYMAHWCAYAFRVYHAYEAADGSEEVTTPLTVGENGLSAREVAVMVKIGRQWAALHRYSVLYLVQTGRPSNAAQASVAGDAEDDGGGVGRGDEGSHGTWYRFLDRAHTSSLDGLDLIRLASLAILLSDPYLRVAAHSGHVCYPSLPSTVLMSWNMSSFHCPRSWLPQTALTAGQGTHRCANTPLGQHAASRIPARSSRSQREAGGTVGVVAALGQWAWHTPTPSTTAGAHEPRRNPEMVYVCDETRFLWLSDVLRDATHALRTPAWTYMHSLYALFEALSPECAADTPVSPPARAAEEVTAARLTRACPSSGRHGEWRGSGCALVDAWILYLDANVVGTCGCFASQDDATAVRTADDARGATGCLLDSGSRGRHGAAPTTATADSAVSAGLVGWNEAQHGAPVLQDWVREASLVTATVGSASTTSSEHPASEGTGSLANAVARSAHQPAHLSAHLYRMHAQLFSRLLTHLVAVPLSLSRFAMALRWNARPAFAAQFDHSLLVFLLETAANPQIYALQRGEQHRRQAREQLTPMHAHASHQRFRQFLARQVNAIVRDIQATVPNGEGERVHAADSGPSDHQHDVPPVRFRSQQQPQQPADGSRAGAADGSAETTPQSEWTSAAAPQLVRAPPPVITRVALFRLCDSSSHTTALNTSYGQNEASVRHVACRQFRGHALRHVELLYTDHCTPQEVLAYLANTRKRDEVPSESEDVRLPSPIEEESRLLCMPISDYIFERRIRGVIQSWNQQRQKQQRVRIGDSHARVTTTIGELAHLLLWDMEYPARAAAEMLVLYLSHFDDKVQLSPPLPQSSRLARAQVSTDELTHEPTLFAHWVVELL